MMRTTILSILLALCATALAAEETPRTISVSGIGFVNIEPDMARLSLSVEQRAASLSAAQQAVAGITADVLGLLADLGIEQRHVNSTGAMVQPDYRWNRQDEQQELVGYIVRRQIDVEIHELELLGRVVDGAVRAGINQVSPPALDSSRRRGAYRDALANAVDDARDNAAALARQLGVTLGPVMRAEAGGYFPLPPPLPLQGRSQAVALAEASVAPATYTPGEMRLEASVHVVYAIAVARGGH
jgi:uncharacterized protein YggE